MPSSNLQKVSECTKYPGHEDFISLKDFSPQHLRAVRQNSELYDLIKCQGALTVKINCRRMKKVKSKVSSKHAEKKKKVVIKSKSTGFVIWVNKRTAGIGQSCQCDQCVLNDKDVEHDQWYEIIIVTNTSTISNQHVADSIEIEFSLNEGQEKTVSLKGNCKYVELNEDICQLHFIICDLEFGSGLHSSFIEFENLLSNAFSWISKKSGYIFSVTVSHPHGSDKHVSFSFEKDLFHSFGGSHNHRRMMEKNKGCVLWPSIWNHAKVYYNVPTCAGSSGAIVVTLTWNKGIIISLHQSGSKRYSWTKEKNVRHFSEFLKEDEEPDRLEDFGPVIQFPSRSEGGENEQNSEIEQKSEAHPVSQNDQVIVLQPRNVRPRRPVPCQITHNHMIDDEKKELLPEPEAFESKPTVIESKERILQVTQVPEDTKPKSPVIEDRQGALLSRAYHSNQEPKSVESKPQSNGSKRIVSPAPQKHSEHTTVESYSSCNDNEKIVQDFQEKTSKSNLSPSISDRTDLPTSHDYQDLQTSDSNPSPNTSERIDLPVSKVYQDLSTSESHPSSSISGRIDLTASQVYQNLHISESNPSPNNNDRIDLTAARVYQALHMPESIPSPCINVSTGLPATQVYQALKTSESYHLSPNNNERIVSLSQSFKEPRTLEQVPSLTNGKGVILSTCHTNCNFKPKKSESILSHGRDEMIISLATLAKKKLEAQELGSSQGQEEKSHLTPNQFEENFKASISSPARTEELVLLPTATFDVTKPDMAESEVCYGPEAHLPLLYVHCEKHPGHEKFFHLGELTLDHIPEEHRKEDILENILHTAALTVKVKTSYVSRRRPEAHPHTGDPYLFSEQKGLKFLRVGTGFVVNAQQEILKYGQICQCIECDSSDGARHECYKIMIMTATHVVFDQAEANRTEIEFSYYQNDKQVATKLLKGKCKHCVVNEDVCWLEYSTHDGILVSKLRESLEQFQKGRLHLSQTKEHDGFVTIISHPHGSTKQHVSFGNILSDSEILSLKEEDSESVDTTSESKSGQNTKAPAFQFYHPFGKIAVWPGDLFKPIICQQIAKVCYTTPTCRGSSGALVCVHKPGVGNIVYTHWGSGDEDNNYNRSGGGTVFYINDNQIFPS